MQLKKGKIENFVETCLQDRFEKYIYPELLCVFKQLDILLICFSFSLRFISLNTYNIT